MSRSPIREDKTCLNCYHVAEKRFCPNCGQENTETRKTFHHLFIHFFEDLTHYENAFWKTIRNLIFKPASLTKQYLSGKRMSYLAPFRLYIFISFVTFFFVAVAPDEEEIGVMKVQFTETEVPSTLSKQERDSIVETAGKTEIFGYKSVTEFDSIQKATPESERVPQPIAWTIRKILKVAEHQTMDELKTKFRQSFISNFPKVLFIYMPIFALVLWLFQSKKKFYYFDHGIFTLHYFSFLLLIYFILTVFESISVLCSAVPGIGFVNAVIRFVLIIYMLYYFFPAHHRFYGESRVVSAIKGIVMFFINLFFITLILLLFAVYTFINLH